MPPSSQALPVALLAGAASANQCCLCTCISAESTPASNRHGRQVNTHHRLPRFPALAVCCYNTLSSCCSLLRHRSCGTERMHAHAVHARDASWQYRRLQQGTRCVANSYALEELVGGSGHTQLLLEQLSMDLENRRQHAAVLAHWLLQCNCFFCGGFCGCCQDLPAAHIAWHAASQCHCIRRYQ